MKISKLYEFRIGGRGYKAEEQEFWEDFAQEIVDKVSDALDYFCWEVSGDTPLECYSAHADLGLYELVEEFVNWSHFGITEKDLELLREMPDQIYDKIYDKYTAKLQNMIERVVKELAKEE